MADGVVGWEERDLHAWAVLAPLLAGRPYLPWSEGAMRPAGLVEVLNALVLDDRRRVLEVGSGVSTIVLARLLADRGGQVVALEHDARWAGWVTAQLAREGLGGVARIELAPLEPRRVDAAGGGAVLPRARLVDAVADVPLRARTVDAVAAVPPRARAVDAVAAVGAAPPAAEVAPRWYAAAGVARALAAGAPDALIVDGPPADAPGLGLAREPALPVLRPSLAPGCLVVLDDVARPGEQAVLAEWEADGDVAFERLPGGIALTRLPLG